MTSHRAALSHLTNTNNEAEAFAIAQQDEGMRADVTLAEWVAFARQCIANETATRKAYGY